MPFTITDRRAVEKSTFPVYLTFRDGDGVVFVPNSGLTWTLSDEAGTVINSRNAVAISSSSTVTVVLSGNDLDLDDGDSRVLTIQGTYNSDLGSNLPLLDQVTFFIDGLTIVT